MQIKNWYESKTFWLNLLTALVMIADLLVQQPFIPPAYLPFIATLVGILNVVLRVWFTDTGIASKAARAAK
jgi:hypothetical protein